VGVHKLDFFLRYKSTQNLESWHQRKAVLINDGSISIDIGNKQHGVMNYFSEGLIGTHQLEICKHGVILQIFDLSSGPTTSSKINFKTRDYVQEAKGLLSDIDRGTAVDGDVLSCNNTEQSGRSQKLCISNQGGGNITGANSLNRIKGKITLEVIPPPKMNLNSATFQIALADGTIPRIFSVPVETIVVFFGNQEIIPDGWLLCDRREFNQKDYPKLVDIFKPLDLEPLHMPDLRGQLLRGSNLKVRENRDDAMGEPDCSARDGVGQKIRSIQKDAFQKHRHRIYTYKNNGYVDGMNTASTVDGMMVGSNHTAEDGESVETRHKNITVNWII